MTCLKEHRYPNSYRWTLCKAMNVCFSLSLEEYGTKLVYLLWYLGTNLLTLSLCEKEPSQFVCLTPWVNHEYPCVSSADNTVNDVSIMNVTWVSEDD